MKIGINCQHINQMPTGPAVYLRNLLSSLADIDNANSYVLYMESLPEDGFVEKLSDSNKNFSARIIKKTLSWTQLDLALDLIKNPVDVFFSSVHTIPTFAALLRPKHMQFVSMIHGLEYTSNNIYGLFSLKGLIQPIILGTTILLSDMVVVPSHSTEQKLLKHFGFVTPLRKVSVIHEGLKENFLKDDLNANTEKVLEEYGVDKGKYLIFVSTVQPRKNLPRTIEAFADSVRNDPDLVLAISGRSGWSYEESFEAPKKYGVRNNVYFLGPVPDDKLLVLMRNAKGFVNFSLDEGFGLPLLEAMSCGIPCAVSDIPAFREIGMDFPLYANPQSVEEISKVIKSLVTSPDTEKLQQQVNHARSFTWTKTAYETLSVIQNLVKNS